VFYPSNRSRAFREFDPSDLKVFFSFFYLSFASEFTAFDGEFIVFEYLWTLALESDSAFRAFGALPGRRERGRREERQCCADGACER